ncbi:hypothetical protein BATDEDRAFT_22610 [Batrachochytrium dendrobatidis JAM81]|uniref:Uncharacterized protein n=1 Tax=Batrachochytrium dendrobatidis (strain JAM81 / FGSC 10211) TaxID=684364 RepID=F4NVM7_BATDJ|nr:uncharacterized protein BATDEDRAFT_22610 [Batrachochytrium dendrobatidis JAM81]EGF83709.1 hypothetical protein BATDEDRAFT_22610 [Batrachochytrium dendrobatidis JAM81]|eukprot:XP_006675615.1 hypothetical protein BATDEDRAFT_22610 [Batrachochytrium dendrobatidis JAM81]
MPKRFLNVEYGTISTEIDVTDFEDLSDVQDAIKSEYDGFCVVIGCLPLPPRQPTRTYLDPTSAAASPALLDFWTAFTYYPNPLEGNTVVQLPADVFILGNHSIGSSIYIRPCYPKLLEKSLSIVQSADIRHLIILGNLGIGKTYFGYFLLLHLARSGATVVYESGVDQKRYLLTPNGVFEGGKHAFWKILDSSSTFYIVDGSAPVDVDAKTILVTLPRREIWHRFSKGSCDIRYMPVGSSYKCFDLQQQLVTELGLEMVNIVRKQDTLYIVDGHTTPRSSCCIVLFMSSPQSEGYKEFVKQKMAREWDFPVWTLNELQTCRRHCYPDVPIETINERYRMYGGVARSVFDIVSNPMEKALTDVDAVKGVRNIGFTIKISANTHTLLHTIVSDDGQYEFLHVDIASIYIGEQLWKRHSAQMITNMQQMFDGIPTKISRHLFEIYGHVVFCTGGQTLKCRCLEDDTIPTAAALDGNYYEPTDDDNFAAIDSLSRQGMFQFTAVAEHPICGVDILTKLCNLYDEPKLYFVVPPHQFKGFKKQSFKPIDGTEQDITPDNFESNLAVIIGENTNLAQQQFQTIPDNPILISSKTRTHIVTTNQMRSISITIIMDECIKVCRQLLNILAVLLKTSGIIQCTTYTTHETHKLRITAQLYVQTLLQIYVVVYSKPDLIKVLQLTFMFVDNNILESTRPIWKSIGFLADTNINVSPTQLIGVALECLQY